MNLCDKGAGLVAVHKGYITSCCSLICRSCSSSTESLPTILLAKSLIVPIGCGTEKIGHNIIIHSGAHHSIGLDRHIFGHKIVNNFLPIIFSICFGCTKEPSH